VTIVLIVAGAALGAPLRYVADLLMQGRHDSVFPWGTYLVNVTGCAVLGFLAAGPAGTALMAFAGTGFCGALTTYSTFGYETVRLAQGRCTDAGRPERGRQHPGRPGRGVLRHGRGSGRRRPVSRAG